jgi:branched-chain amino acid transport system ATP-binding protein
LASEALSIRDVDTYYGDSHVLHRIGFTLQSGKLLGLLGRNGAGKTTCMATIMGFLRPRRGAISLFGEPVAGLAPETIARKGICLVPQGRRVFRSLTVRENLAVAAQTRTKAATPGRSSVCSRCFPRLRSVTRSMRARCPAASSRCSPSGAA